MSDCQLILTFFFKVLTSLKKCPINLIDFHLAQIVTCHMEIPCYNPSKFNFKIDKNGKIEN